MKILIHKNVSEYIFINTKEDKPLGRILRPCSRAMLVASSSPGQAGPASTQQPHTAAVLLSLVTKSFKQFKPSQIIQDLSEKANCFQSIETLENQKRK